MRHLGGRTNKPINSIRDGLAWLLPSRLREDASVETGPMDSEKISNVFLETMETSAHTNLRTLGLGGSRAGMFQDSEYNIRRMGTVPEHECRIRHNDLSYDFV